MKGVGLVDQSCFSVDCGSSSTRKKCSELQVDVYGCPTVECISDFTQLQETISPGSGKQHLAYWSSVRYAFQPFIFEVLLTYTPATSLDSGSLRQYNSSNQTVERTCCHCVQSALTCRSVAAVIAREIHGRDCRGTFFLHQLKSAQ